MIIELIKKSLKNNKILFAVASFLLYIYLKFVYKTSKWHFVLPQNCSQEEFSSLHGAVFAMWHNSLAFGPYIFKDLPHTHALVSPHSDGKIIGNIIEFFNFGVIAGSTNRNPIGALRNIIKNLTAGNNVVITPDGPRGPVYEINSSICDICHKYNRPLIPVSCKARKYFLLKSWDRLIMPLPFNHITVSIGNALTLSGDVDKDNELLKKQLLDACGL